MPLVCYVRESSHQRSHEASVVQMEEAGGTLGGKASWRLAGRKGTEDDDRDDERGNTAGN